jgi:hypothetical protein
LRGSFGRGTSRRRGAELANRGHARFVFFDAAVDPESRVANQRAADVIE